MFYQGIHKIMLPAIVLPRYPSNYVSRSCFTRTFSLHYAKRMFYMHEQAQGGTSPLWTSLWLRRMCEQVRDLCDVPRADHGELQCPPCGSARLSSGCRSVYGCGWYSHDPAERAACTSSVRPAASHASTGVRPCALR